MKKILTFIAVLFITANGFAQYPFKTRVEPNLRDTDKHVMVQETNTPKPTGTRYARKGEYKSVTPDQFKTYIDIPTVISSGTYTPTLSDSSNITACSVGTFNYMRVGDIVTVSGLITIDPLADSTTTYIEFTLPFEAATNSVFGNANFVAGTTHQSGQVTGEVDEGEARLDMYPIVQTSKDWSVSLTYRID